MGRWNVMEGDRNIGTYPTLRGACGAVFKEIDRLGGLEDMEGVNSVLIGAHIIDSVGDENLFSIEEIAQLSCDEGWMSDGVWIQCDAVTDGLIVLAKP